MKAYISVWCECDGAFGGGCASSCRANIPVLARRSEDGMARVSYKVDESVLHSALRGIGWEACGSEMACPTCAKEWKAMRPV
jgi:hypothetical protein